MQTTNSVLRWLACSAVLLSVVVYSGCTGGGSSSSSSAGSAPAASSTAPAVDPEQNLELQFEREAASVISEENADQVADDLARELEAELAEG